MEPLLLMMMMIWAIGHPAALLVSGENQEARLFRDLMADYKKATRPVSTQGSVIDVLVKMTLTNLISLKERDEILTTNVWLELQWEDERLKWDESEYGGIDIIRVPSKMVWLPDIVLENNVDGQFEITLFVNVLIYPWGLVYWLPPAIYRSPCSIVVTYFPFDWQNCSLIFRSQTFSSKEINLLLTLEDNVTVEWIHIDPEAFTENGEWSIRHRPAKKITNERFQPEDLEYQQVTYFLIIKRKPLFYVINIILPCVLTSCLAILVYFLPGKAGGQKITLSIMVLLGQTVFLILISKKVPETSQDVPLIAKYLMFKMIVVVIIVANCVVVLNVSLRTPNTHSMSQRTREIFIELLPRLLRMIAEEGAGGGEPEAEAEAGWPGGPPMAGEGRPRRRSSLGLMAKAEEYMMRKPRSELMFERQRQRHGLTGAPNGADGVNVGTTPELFKNLSQYGAEIRSIVDSCKFIFECIRDQNDLDSENDEWILMGQVIDRLCFWLMSILILLGTLSIFLMGHLNAVPLLPFPGDPKTYTPPL
ncbi:acetylcholine receptor subunit gamma-like [Lampetra fluviatilis]